MKCYTCGRQTTDHAVGCPELKKSSPYDPNRAPRPLLNPVYQKSPHACRASSAYPMLGDELDYGVNSSAPPHDCANCRAMRGHKTVGDTVLPIATSAMVLPGYCAFAYPDTELRLLRFWVDEDVAPHFKITGVLAGNTHLWITDGHAAVSATHFSMAHRESYHLATEHDAKLTPSQRVSVGVQNVSDEAREFRGLFECQTVKAPECTHCSSRLRLPDGRCSVCKMKFD